MRTSKYSQATHLLCVDLIVSVDLNVSLFISMRRAMAKTFDQLRLTLSEDELVNHELTFPSEAYRSFFVLEPITHQGITRVSVTARDENMNVLWGSMICEGHLPSGETTPVALYSTMLTQVSKQLQDAQIQSLKNFAPAFNYLLPHG